MKLQWFARSSYPLAGFGCLALQSAVCVAPAYACEGEVVAARWEPERSWPSACERGVPVDGLVVLEGEARAPGIPGGDGALQVLIQRMQRGVAVESYPGQVTPLDATSVLFRAERPLAPNSDYVVVAARLPPEGQQPLTSFSSAFTTGEGAMPPLQFESAPSLRIERSEKELQRCEEDGCGEAYCEPTGETSSIHLVRVAVPPIGGGLAQRDYAVSAQLVTSSSNGQASVVASSEPSAVQAGKRSFLVIELPPQLDRTEGCVTIHASDVAGHTLTSEPVCTPLSPSSAEAARGSEAPQGGAEAHASDAPTELADPDEASDEPVDQPIYAHAIDPATGEFGGDDDDPPQPANAAGCALGPRAGASDLAWLALGFVALRARRGQRLSARVATKH